jgi:hypothetical protein
MQALSKQGIVYASHAFAGQGILVMLAFHCMGRLFFFLQSSTLSKRELYYACSYSTWCIAPDRGASMTRRSNNHYKEAKIMKKQKGIK